MTKRNKLILSLIALSVLIVIGVLLLGPRNSAPTQKLADFKQLPGNSDVTPLANLNETIYFSNGRGVVSYSKETGASKNITNTFSFPKIHKFSVSPDGNFLAFQTNEHHFSTEPFKSIVSTLDHPEETIWWLLDTKNGAISLVHTGPENLKWLDKTSYVFDLDNQIIKRSIGSTDSETIYEGKDIVTLLNTINGEIFVNERDSQVAKIDQNKKVSRIYDSASSILYSNSPNCFFYQNTPDETDETTSKLVGCTKKEKTFDADIISGRFSADTKYFYYYTFGEEGQLLSRYVDIATGKEGAWETDIPNSEDIEILDTSDPEDILVRAENRFYSQKAIDSKLISDNNSYTYGDLIIDFDKVNQSIIVSKWDDYTDSDRQGVIAYIKNKGFDPNLFEIDFKTLTNSDIRFN